MHENNLRELFDRVVVISSPGSSQVDKFFQEVSKCDWPFARPDVFEAVDGRKLPVPNGWISGCVDWGNMQSQRHVLERALLDDVGSLLVFEDTARLRPDFRSRIAEFLSQVPEDWEGLILGGEHFYLQRTPVTVEVVRSFSFHRTHAYAVRGGLLAALYQDLCSTSGHCDYDHGPLAVRHKIYSANPPLVDRGRDESNAVENSLIKTAAPVCPARSSNVEQIPARVDGQQQIALVRGPREAVDLLRTYGFHTGYWRDHKTGYDSRLVEILSSRADQRAARLREWINWLRPEADAIPHGIVSVWHPDVSLELLRAAWDGPVAEISVPTLSGAVEICRMWRGGSAAHEPSDSPQFVLILAQGRSGSTLLMRMLNAVPGVRICGENYKASDHLARFAESFRQVAARDYGGFLSIAWKLPCDYLALLDTMREFVLDLYDPARQCRVVGFKEIRYGTDYDELCRDTDFLKSLFPNVKFIINTRRTEDCIKSGWWAVNPSESAKTLDATKANFERLQAENPERCFSMPYEELVHRSPV